LDARPTAAACAPRLFGGSGRRQIFGGAQPRLATALGYLALPDRLLGRRCVWATATRSRAPVAVEWLSGACLVVRRAAFEAVGGFREDLFMYNEDLDLGARLRAAGWELLLVPGVAGYHAGGRSSRFPVDVAGLWSRSTRRYLGPGRRASLVAWLLLAGMARRHVVARLGGRRGATFAPRFASELLRSRGRP
jgi:GT2 family glycosyltransferase